MKAIKFDEYNFDDSFLIPLVFKYDDDYIHEYIHEASLSFQFDEKSYLEEWPILEIHFQYKSLQVKQIFYLKLPCLNKLISELISIQEQGSGTCFLFDCDKRANLSFTNVDGELVISGELEVGLFLDPAFIESDILIVPPSFIDRLIDMIIYPFNKNLRQFNRDMKSIKNLEPKKFDSSIPCQGARALFGDGHVKSENGFELLASELSRIVYIIELYRSGK